MIKQASVFLANPFEPLGNPKIGPLPSCSDFLLVLPVSLSPTSTKYLAYVCKQDISLMTAFLKNRGAFYNPWYNRHDPLLDPPTRVPGSYKSQKRGLVGSGPWIRVSQPPFMKITRGSIVKPPT
ncbi:hypothetical protein CEXT_687871 [Caerostris extrusa]|uniref:Uncharacterized protein n=1 Tax=Caerostris extrusa TaxID=172846 RepID=A0AAV4QRE7_CAEEX|nr:hypothetical protein CEXT_687871 [Caerostris extrusa]